MKVLVFVKATPNSEQGIKPSPEIKQLFADMERFNEQLVKAGIMQEADGLKPSSAGKRIKFSQGHVSVIDGPFAETKELVAGYWVWNVKSVDEAVEWAKRCPNPMPGEEGVLEIRPVYQLEDFAGLVSPEELQREISLREQMRRPARRKSRAKAKSKRAPARKKSVKRKPRRAK